ncbi:hypothetical protein R1sor_011786 [Riccia sorocarpa]|uniref:Cytochrome P450 n=1 Tax=Riccia sorocarpa TaxID=122646 RepID=A0ABD3I1V6_9MARC
MWTEESTNAVQKIVTTLSVFCIVFLIRAWWNWQTAGLGLKSIPSKGSLGWPIVGESLSVRRCSGDISFEGWLRERIQKYGTMCKSHLFLKPSILMTTTEEVKFVFDDPHKQMRNGAPESLKRIFGSTSIFSLEGEDHRHVYKILNDSILMPELKKKTAEFNRIMRHSLSSWDGQTLDILKPMQTMIFKLMTFNFFGIPWEGEIADRIASLLYTVVLGPTSLPFYFPGTDFYKAMNAKTRVTELVVPIIRELRSAETGRSSKYARSAEKFPYQNLFNIKFNGGKEMISDTGVCDILLSPILSGGQGPGTVVALAIFHLTKNPSMLQKAQAEVDRVRKQKEELGEADLSVSDLKDLKYLTQVYNEVLRISTIVPGVGRVATTDIHFNGHVIPKGWFMLAPFVLIHMDPELYPEPSKFNPDRFETPPNPGKFLPFGRGYRHCVGRDFTKLVVVMTLYHILSNFTWDVVSCSGKVQYVPFVKMIGDFQLSIKSRTHLL